MHTLLFLSPGHFHAALTLRERHPLVNGEIFVYAEPGPDLDAFLALVESFNGRAERPTAWRPTVQAGPDPLGRLIAERRGEAVILAGRNDGKIAAIARLHEAGFAVLADKPWLVGVEGLPELERATAGGALLMDIMTGRYEITHLLPKRLTGVPEVFGKFHAPAGEPAITMETVHHLAKTVNGVPLIRPDWYFDVRVQGDGIVDIPSHLVDRVLWMVAPGGSDYGRDVNLEAARLWDTPVPAEAFTRITGRPAFPPFLEEAVVEEVLRLRCNGEFAFRLRDVPVRLRGEWHLEAPPGGGDTYGMRLRGTRAEIAVEMGPATGFEARVVVRPRGDPTPVGAALERALAGWREKLPGLAVVAAPDGFEVHIPPPLRITHEEQFALVLNAFLGHLEHGTRLPHLPAELRTKYTLAARASALARRGG